MDEALVAELESAIADAGAILVRAEKYKRCAGPEGEALARRALAVGDSSRRLHRRDALDTPAARTLLAEARAVTAELRALLAAARATPEYRAAVTAHAAGDHATLAPLLPAIFTGLELAPGPRDLFLAVPCFRRGRLRPPVEVADEVAEARATGVAAAGDDLSPGADTELPAVVVAAAPPSGEPVVLRLPGGEGATPLTLLVDTGDLLVHRPRLVVPAAVALVAERLELEEQLRVEIAPAEWRRWRTALVTSLAAARVPVEPA